MVDLRQRLSDDGRHQALAGFYDLFDLPAASGLDLPQWLSGWAKAFDKVHDNGGQARAYRVRRDYHLRAFQELADWAGPEVILPCLIDLWPVPLPDQPDETLQALAADLRIGAEHSQLRQGQLDAFLDSVELELGEWAEEYGI